MERDYPKAVEILQLADEIAEARKPLLPKTGDPSFDSNRHALTLEKRARIARFRGEKEKVRGYFEAARRLL